MCNLGRKILHQILLAQSYILTSVFVLFGSPTTHL